ncbi:precorrin-3B C(17)-methyltransferase [Aestuariirhabdus litorea]|uniref:Precorrin-3B C(17)-methyltransferase n=1 Tax=Aestuariirhabdus litorea TaxID=2528527 RepID=A0A3P3VP88_9GAMM|nr:precorrin-3B C(17)-methyltransferase [Aestuariirhabdus litorea]RRJ84515.1 precorrin-3B C(17)-methyltransferase [Aestuariirhabdus litorea]RWW97740.1 precorrin-3B C(17)-methyltransferase [Endozoicomonadaceae bacterium GTF-13]
MTDAVNTVTDATHTNGGSLPGTLYLVGIGPGDHAYLAPAAKKALSDASDWVAYGLYLDLLGELGEGKQHHDRPLGEEIERARLALRLAIEGKSTALISSGDIGIYAMATLVFELLDGEFSAQASQLAVEVVPGISAVQMAAARTGAPLGHDFCTISLSDLLTPWETIEARLHAAGQGDFVTAFYNPVSRQRDWQLARAQQILLGYRPATTPVVVARNLGRSDEQVRITTLAELVPAEVDMLTLVLVGNSESRTLENGRWVYTPRGYRKKLSANRPLANPHDAAEETP